MTKKSLLRLITFLVSTIALLVPVAGPLSWFSYSPQLPQELANKWKR